MTALAQEKKLTLGNIEAAAKLLGVSVAHIKAILEVETKGSGFDDDGLPVILFERHIMYRLTKEKYGQAKADSLYSKYPNVINPKSGGYGKYSEQQGRLDVAAKNIDRNLALQSASWGLGQVMGFNYKLAGFQTIQSFVNAMYRSEGEQLMAMVRFIKSDSGMLNALKRNDWADFAKRYNGPDFAKNKYDTKLKSAFEKWGLVG